MMVNDMRKKMMTVGLAVALGKFSFDNFDLSEASPEEQRRLHLTTFDGIYINSKQTKSIKVVKPKPLFKPVFQVAAQKEGSVINLSTGREKESSGRPCFWWKRGRVEFPVQSTELFLVTYHTYLTSTSEVF